MVDKLLQQYFHNNCPGQGLTVSSENMKTVNWARQRGYASEGPRGTVGRMTMKSTRRVLGHSLLRSLVRSHRSLIRLLRTARFARALRCAHSFARSLTHSLRSSWERDLCL